MPDALVERVRELAQTQPPRPDLVEAAGPLHQPIDFSSLVEGLVEKHWFVCEDYLPSLLCTQLYQELIQLKDKAVLSAAGIGRGKNYLLEKNIRSDLTHWLDSSSQVQQDYLALMRELKDYLNRELFLGLFEYESHYAFYPPGAFYKKHLDAFKGRSNRVVTTVLYLNPDWKPEDGGQMRLYDPQSDLPLLDVAPRRGTLVCFLSDQIPHEVLATKSDRASLAGWFRINTSINGIIDPSL